MNSKRFKADTSYDSERSHGWEGMGEKERSGYQAKASQDYRAEHRTKYKSNDQGSSKEQQRGSKDRRGTDKNTQLASDESGYTPKQTNRSSSSSTTNKQNQREQNNKPKTSEAKASSSIHDASSSHSYSRPDSNRGNNFQVVVPNRTGSKLVVKRIQVSEVTVPTAPPKIILKRKEIQISPPITKLPANLEPPAQVKEVEANQPAELEDFEMINESQDLPAVGDETSMVGDETTNTTHTIDQCNRTPDSEEANRRTHGGRG